MKSHLKRHAQSGMMLLEALIAILIFAVGILGIVGLQATAIKQGTDARYRSEAAMLVNQLIGQMWLTDGNPATLVAQFTDTGTSNQYTTWAQTVAATLPVPENPDPKPPTVDVTTNVGASQGTVTVTVYWQSPSDCPSPYTNCPDPHKYVAIAQIKPSL